MEPIDTKGLSKYAKYHYKFLGFNFRNTLTGKIYTKGDFWDCFRKLAEKTVDNPNIIAPDGFELISYT